MKLATNVDLSVVAARTTGFAGADLASLVNEATLLAARRDQAEVSMGDFEEAIDRVLAGLKRKRVMSQREREIVAAHEAGHAIVASVLPGVDPVHKISIVQRGYDALGHTLQLPQEDRYLRTRRELLNQLVVWLGGRASTQGGGAQPDRGASVRVMPSREVAGSSNEGELYAVPMGSRTTTVVPSAAGQSIAPQNAATHSGQLSVQMTSRSPGWRPASLIRRANVSAVVRNSSHVYDHLRKPSS